MRNWRSVFFLLLASPMFMHTAEGAEIHGRSSTQLMWFNSIFTDTRQTELAEYLRLSVTGIDKDGKIAFYGYGRATQDMSNGEGLNGRLYYLYGEIRDILDHADLRIGRQFVNLSAGSALIDGAEVDVRDVGPVSFTLLGGRDVVFGLDREIRDPGNTVLGVSAALTGYKKTAADVSWLRKYDQGDIARDQLGASFRQYLLNSLKIYGNTRYDLVTESFSEALAGVKYYPTASLIFTGEWYRSYPTFDTTSIFSVFAVDRYQEGIFRTDYIVNDRLSVNIGYNRQEFGEGGSANVYHAGIGLRPVDPLKINLEYDDRLGYYGKMNGVIADATYDVDKKLQVSGGIAFDVYQRDGLTGDEFARKYWLGGKYRLAKNMAASLRIEDDVNIRYTSNVQGRFIFDYDF
jgi:hypothetical protein